MMKLKITGILLIGLMSFLSGICQEVYHPTPENLEARKWFQDAKFGMFIHWGIYSELAGAGEPGLAEWVMDRKKMPIKDYEKLATFFNPINFNAKEWVATAKNAGMKYITITSKHHDGFAMFNSKYTDYDIVDRTPYKKDIMKDLAEECHKQGIKLFFYYSHLDWHNPDYFPRGITGRDYTGRPESGDWNAYLTYMNNQLTELLTNYGPIGGIWFDGWWDKHGSKDWQLEKQYALIHKLQPQTLIGNNHHLAPFQGEDFQMFEQDIPGQNSSGHSAESVIGNLPLETCETMNGSWGFNLFDKKFKSTNELIGYIVKAAGNNANFLLNTGPMPNGSFQPENLVTLKAIGVWMQKYGETIYGTRAGSVAPQHWGVSTAKDNKTYIHVLDPSVKTLFFTGIKGKIKSISTFDNHVSLKFLQNEFGVTVVLPASAANEPDRIIVVE
jgi:alpha-L-fucosidase